MKKSIMIFVFALLPLVGHTGKLGKTQKLSLTNPSLPSKNLLLKAEKTKPKSSASKPVLQKTAFPKPVVSKPTVPKSDSSPPSVSKPIISSTAPSKPKSSKPATAKPPKKPLYLAEEADDHIKDMVTFEKKIRGIAIALNVPTEWMMALIHSESDFNPKKKNKRGSGAKGLIQMMPIIYKDLGIKKVPSSPFKQLDYAKRYLLNKKEQHGKFNNLTDLKLAVLYPGAIGKPNWYVLFKKPSRAYQQNSGLDLNKDGKVSVGDVKTKMKQDYKKAYWVEP